MSNYDKFYDYLGDLHRNQMKLSELLGGKLEAVENFDTERLEQIMKEEQVFVLLSKGFENSIQKHKEQLSLSGAKLSEIIEELPAGEQPRFRELFKKLRAGLEMSQALNVKCQELLEERLYTINKTIKAADKTANTNYGKAADHPSEGGARLLAKSI